MTISIDLSGRRLLIVGASSGIGRATAIAAAAGGADVAVVGRREKQLNEVIEVAGRGIAVAADLRDGAECARAVAEAASGLGGLDAALFPIGYSPLRLLAKTDGPTWVDTFATNVAAPAMVTGAALPHLPAGAPLIYLSSASVGQPVHGLGAYGASKAALDYSIRTWRLEHPEYRFMRLTVGATTPTDLYSHYEADVLA
nr:SDR family oxidoreductase [Micromonospora sp. DSM 115978]